MPGRSPRTVRLAILVIIALLVGCSSQESAPSADTAATDRDWYAGRVLYEINVPELGADGTLDGVIAQLDRLQDLGVQVLVVNPIHPRGANPDDPEAPSHPYAVADHLAVDEDLGGAPAFARFCAAARARGMRVILDMVLNHGAVDHVERSVHPDWFAGADGGAERRITAWRTVVDFAHGDPAVLAYQETVLRTWLERGVDGFRCLHANLLPAASWQTLIGNLRRDHPALYLLADAIDPALLDLGFDGVYRPQLVQQAGFAYLDDMAQPGLQDDLWYGAVDTTINLGIRGTTFLEDRFGERAAVAFAWPRGRGFAAALLTLPGTPKLYNGQEWGCTERPRLATATPLPADRDENWSRTYEDLLRLRTSSEALRIGEVRRIPVTERELLVFTRRTPDEHLLVAINLTDTAPVFPVPDDLAGLAWQEWREGRFAGDGQSIEGEQRVEPCGYRVWRASRREPPATRTARRRP